MKFPIAISLGCIAAASAAHFLGGSAGSLVEDSVPILGANQGPSEAEQSPAGRGELADLERDQPRSAIPRTEQAAEPQLIEPDAPSMGLGDWASFDPRAVDLARFRVTAIGHAMERYLDPKLDGASRLSAAYIISTQSIFVDQDYRRVSHYVEHGGPPEPMSRRPGYHSFANGDARYELEIGSSFAIDQTYDLGQDKQASLDGFSESDLETLDREVMERYASAMDLLQPYM